MQEAIELGEISVLVTRKAIKHVHLSVHPPTGRVTLVAPASTSLDVARAYCDFETCVDSTAADQAQKPRAGSAE